MERDEYGHYPWRTAVIVTDPLGARVQVSVTAPISGLWSEADRCDAAEVAARAAHEAMTRINDHRRERAEEVPF